MTATIRSQVRGAASIQNAFLGAPIAAAPARIVASALIANGERTIAAQPDVPRNLTASFTDADDSVTAAVLTIVGRTIQGVTITDVVTLAQLKAGWVSRNCYATVASVVVSGVAGTVTADVDVLVVGVGNVIALPAPISLASQVKYTNLGAVPVAAPVIATGPNSSGVDASASTYNGTKLLWVTYNPMEE